MSSVGGINLNAIVSLALDPLHKIEKVLLKKFKGTVYDDEGRDVNVYFDAMEIDAQIQSPDDSHQEWVRAVNDNTIHKIFWTNIDIEPLDRNKGYGGDLITYDGSDWLVIAQPDNFTKQEWTSVIAERILPNDA